MLDSATTASHSQNKKLDKVDKLLLNTDTNSVKTKPSISTPSGTRTVKEVSEYLTNLLIEAHQSYESDAASPVHGVIGI